MDRSIALSLLTVIGAFLISGLGYTLMGIGFSAENDAQDTLIFVGALIVGLALLVLIVGIILAAGHYRTGVALQQLRQTAA